MNFPKSVFNDLWSNDHEVSRGEARPYDLSAPRRELPKPVRPWGPWVLALALILLAFASLAWWLRGPPPESPFTLGPPNAGAPAAPSAAVERMPEPVAPVPQAVAPPQPEPVLEAAPTPKPIAKSVEKPVKPAAGPVRKQLPPPGAPPESQTLPAPNLPPDSAVETLPPPPPPPASEFGPG